MNSRSMAGWIGFAGIVMVILGGLTFFEGLIALLRDNYYVPTGEGFLVVDVTGWGWIMLIWGTILACVGLALLMAQAGHGGRRSCSWPPTSSANSASSATRTTLLVADDADAEHHRSLRLTVRWHKLAPAGGRASQMNRRSVRGPTHQKRPRTERRAKGIEPRRGDVRCGHLRCPSRGVTIGS